MPNLTRARCQNCGRESEVEWTLGSKCPHCGSEKFFPVVLIEKPQARASRSSAGAASRKPIGMVLAVLFFAAAITALILRVRSTTRPKEYFRTSTMMCTNCERTFRQKFSTKEVFPEVVCPYCKQKAAYRAVQCRRCGTIFPLEPRGKANPTIDVFCPSCHSNDINLDSSSIPVEEEQEP